MSAAPPPRSRGLVSASTLEMDVEPPPATRPGGPLDPLRRSLTDVTAARLRRYHQQCDARLEATLRLFRARQGPPLSSSRSRSRTSSRHARARARARGRASPERAALDRQWRLVRESSDIRVFRPRLRRAACESGAWSAPSAVLARGSVHGALGDVMNGLYADSTRTARVLELLLSPRSLDARVLQVDKRSSDARPFQFAGITWSALKLPGPRLGVCKHRDFLCFKKMDTFKDDFGHELGFLVLQSIEPQADELPAPAPAHASSSLVRGSMSLAVLFQRDGPERVTLFAHGHFDARGRLPPLLGDACVAEWLTSLANTVQSGQAKNLSLLLASQRPPASPGPSTGTRRRCGVCARVLFFWAAPRCCRGCWTPCCRACRVTRPIFCAHQHGGSSSAAAAAPCSETFCLACVCAVIPSGAAMNARLLQRLAKKRKRTLLPPGAFRPTLSAASSATDGSVAPLRPPSERERERRLLGADVSTISALSSRESDKFQLHRLSLTARPAKRQYLQPERVQGTAVDAPTELLEVLEHTQTQAQTQTQTQTQTAPRPESRRRAQGDKPEDEPPRDDEYYQRLLQSYLLSASSSRSLASALSFSSYGDKPAPRPPAQARPRAAAAAKATAGARGRDAPSACSSTRGSSLSADVGVHPRRPLT